MAQAQRLYARDLPDLQHNKVTASEGMKGVSDLTDEEWSLVAPMIPPARRGGRPRDVNMREIINGLLYLLWTGCQWQALPKDLPPKRNRSSQSRMI